MDPDTTSKNEIAPDNETSPKPELDADTLAFVGRVFQFARMGHAEELAELFGQGLPANLRNDKGDSLLMLAAYNGQAEATRVILEAGGDPELANDRGQTPLAGAAFKGDMAIAGLLLAQGAQVDGTGTGSRTALMTAAMFNRTEMVALLLAHGADPDVRDASGLDAAALAESMGAADTPAQLAGAKRSGTTG
jgi:ankyrin repeat protein